MSELWFKARRYGWGWTPCPLAGRVVTILIAAAFIGGNLAIVLIAADPADIHWTLGFLPHVSARSGLLGWILAWNALVAGAMVATCWTTGERPRWRWGKPGR